MDGVVLYQLLKTNKPKVLDFRVALGYSEDRFRVEFPVLSRGFAEKILDRLSYYNVGKTEDSNIMIIDPAAVVYKRPKANDPHDIPMKHFQKFVNSLKSRLTVAQVSVIIS
ncbi:unnamed protein product [Rodentolepis nana]|uniref:CRAL-TRIO domain-containing protein n=1 Tax=Rodentolepis nana TaxID=102285 RepID=A0A0R3TRF6_RODNA|nr:unnamed protein product [Rodentolepis nana]